MSPWVKRNIENGGTRRAPVDSTLNDRIPADRK